MNLMLKQRILGAIVLIALIIIVIAVLLHRSNSLPKSSVSHFVSIATTTPLSNSAIANHPEVTTIKSTTTLKPNPSLVNNSSNSISNPASTAAKPDNIFLNKATLINPSSSTSNPVSIAPSSNNNNEALVNPSSINLNKKNIDVKATSTSTIKSVVSIKPQTVEPKAIAKTHQLQAQATLPVKSSSVSNTSEVKQGWVVQVGSFKSSVDAKHLAHQLQAKKFKAVTQNIQTSKHGAMTRVIVGKANLTHTQALKLQTLLQQQLKLSGFLTHYHLSQNVSHRKTAIAHAG